MEDKVVSGWRAVQSPGQTHSRLFFLYWAPWPIWPHPLRSQGLWKELTHTSHTCKFVTGAHINTHYVYAPIQHTRLEGGQQIAPGSWNKLLVDYFTVGIGHVERHTREVMGQAPPVSVAHNLSVNTKHGWPLESTKTQELPFPAQWWRELKVTRETWKVTRKIGTSV